MIEKECVPYPYIDRLQVSQQGTYVEVEDYAEPLNNNKMRLYREHIS